MAPAIKAVLFDLDGTLLDHDAAAEVALLRTLQTTPGLHDVDHAPARRRWKQLEELAMERVCGGDVPARGGAVVRPDARVPAGGGFVGAVGGRCGAAGRAGRSGSAGAPRGQRSGRGSSPNILLIPATSFVAHLREDVSAAHLTLPKEELAKLTPSPPEARTENGVLHI
jgi:hypothetical protein